MKQRVPLAIIKQSRIHPIEEHHPWVMSGSVQVIRGNPEPGALVEVASESGKHLGWGHFSPASQIRVRMISWSDSMPDESLWIEDMLSRSLHRRDELAASPDTNACRLVFSESDLLPGLIVDRYAEYLAIQTLTAGMDRLKPLIVELLQKQLAPLGIIEKNAVSMRRHEGLEDQEGILAGEVPEESIAIRESGFQYSVNLMRGQKTGFYLDQRDNKTLMAPLCSGKRVLDAFSYTGSFAVHAYAAGATSVVRMDNSAPALETGLRNLEQNGFAARPGEAIRDDVFDALRRFADDGRTFDVIILDPPKLAPVRSQVDRAMRAYKDLNLQAMKCLGENGFLVSFSCSGAIEPERFREAVRWAAKDAGRTVQIVRQLAQGTDHPILLTFPESAYLKGLISRVI